MSRRALLAAVILVAGGDGVVRPDRQGSDRVEAVPIRGADVSFTLLEEAAGRRFTQDGVAAPIERILASQGANFVRLRLWVDPPAGYNDLESTLVLARRARDAGLSLLLDLHYSDFWADSKVQDTPAAWRSLGIQELARMVRTYTRRTINSFLDHGVSVDIVQIGNEITHGFLWPLGRLREAVGGGWSGFLPLLRAGIAGARDAIPDSERLKIMVHVDRGGDNRGCRYFYDHLVAQRIEFDMIGLSYYPFWHGPLADLRANLADLAYRYGKDIVVVETAYPWTLEPGDEFGNVVTRVEQLPDAGIYPPTPQGQDAYFEGLRQTVAQVPGRRGAGFLAWEPGWLPGVGWRPHAGNHHSNLTMFDWRGAALPSLTVFRS